MEKLNLRGIVISFGTFRIRLEQCLCVSVDSRDSFMTRDRTSRLGVCSRIPPTAKTHRRLRMQACSVSHVRQENNGNPVAKNPFRRLWLCRCRCLVSKISSRNRVNPVNSAGSSTGLHNSMVHEWMIVGCGSTGGPPFGGFVEQGDPFELAQGFKRHVGEAGAARDQPLDASAGVTEARQAQCLKEWQVDTNHLRWAEPPRAVDLGSAPPASSPSAKTDLLAAHREHHREGLTRHPGICLSKRAPRKGPKTKDCVKNTCKMTKFKGLQLHHLPHDVLRIILSRLTLKEAVRMSILSRRWRRLWKCYPKLVFTRATMRGSNAVVGCRKPPLRTRFIRGINSILRQLRSTNLNKFVVKFALRKRHTSHIDRWIKFSATSKTKHVVMDLSPGLKGSNKRDDMYSFPLHLFSGSSGSCVRSLCLGFVYLTPPADLHGFSNLKKLSLHMVTITGELQCLFPECAVLEWLSITKCRMVGLSIGQELSRLQYLCVKICSLQKLDIRAPNLTTLVFADLMLFSASDCFNYVCNDVVNALSHVQSLSIYFQMNTKVQGFVKNPSRLTNLRHLTLEINIGGWPEAPGGVLRLAYLLECAVLPQQPTSGNRVRNPPRCLRTIISRPSE
uniref:Uncharacterized protein n=1 Tax=Aegilops tauschii TaxID=37682 RepID=M8CEX4_AEGTA